jgi:transposase
MDEIIIDKGCGLDVHKETVVACVMGSGIKKEIRTFSTKTNDLLRCNGEYGSLLEAGLQCS